MCEFIAKPILTDYERREINFKNLCRIKIELKV